MEEAFIIRSLIMQGRTNDSRLAGIKDPGLYRWWFRKDSLKSLGLSHFNLSAFNYKQLNGQDYYALYFGKAEQHTLLERLDWHINNHSVLDIITGRLSTLRLSLYALLHNPTSLVSIPDSRSIVNNFIDENCIVEWIPYPPGSGSKIRNDEKNELSQSYWYPLNIEDNKKADQVKLDYYKNLKKLRSSIRKDLLSSI